MLMQDEMVEIIAGACHAAWYAYAVVGMGEKGNTWSNTSEEIKAFARSSVEFQLFLKDTMSVDRRAILSHENWMKQLKANGWKYGPEKNVKKKTTPCMVPYENLPKSQRLKDEIFVETFLQMRRLLDSINAFTG